MLYQNELSVEYFGDLVSAAAAVSLNQSKVPSQVDRAAPGKGSGGLFQNIRPQGASPGTSNASRSSNLLRASQPGLRLLMALFRLQEEEDREEEEGGDEETEEEEGEENESEGDSEEELSTTTDDNREHLPFEGDDMDEESLAIAREMRDDQRDFEEQEQEPDGADLLLHEPDESELISGDAVVSLIAIPAPWEPWDTQEQGDQALGRDLARHQGGSDSDDMDGDLRDTLCALRPPMSRSEGSSIMHGNATTHEDAG